MENVEFTVDAIAIDNPTTNTLSAITMYSYERSGFASKKRDTRTKREVEKENQK